MNAVFYGVDTPSAREIEKLTVSIGRDTIFKSRRQCTGFAISRPEDDALRAERSDITFKALCDPLLSGPTRR